MAINAKFKVFNGTTWDEYNFGNDLSGYATQTWVTNTFLTQHTFNTFVQNLGNTFQALDADLTGTSGLLKKTAANTWTLDTNTYLTTSAASSTYLPKSGGTMTGMLTLGSNVAGFGREIEDDDGGTSISTIYVPYSGGTMALTSDIPTNYVTTDTAQTISGTKTYTGNNIFKNNYFEIKASTANDDSWIKLTNATDSAYYAFGIRRPYDTYGLQMKYHPASGSDVYYNIWHAGNFTPSSYLTKSAASSTYLGISAKAESAKTADTATEANYASEAGKSDSATWAAEANWATEAGDAERAMNDSDDNPINTTYIKVTTKGVANGVAPLDATGKIASSYLPSYVDDVLEYTNRDSFPTTGETGKIYINISDGKTYRWSGSTYSEISASLALGETSSTAYAGDKGKANAAAITSLQNNKLDKSGGTITGDLTVNGYIIADELNASGMIIEAGKALGDKYQAKVSALGSNIKPVYISASGTFSEAEQYAGGTAVTLNGTDKSATTASFYAPTSVGTNGQVLVATGTGAPKWDNGSGLIVGTAQYAVKAEQDENGNNIVSNYLPKSGGTITGSIIPDTNIEYDLGDSSHKFNFIYTDEVEATNITADDVNTSNVYTTYVKLSELSVPSSSGSTSYSQGTDGQVLKSNGETVYWGSDNNTWRGIQNNLTSTSTTDSLSAYQGKLLNDKFASYLPLSGGTFTGVIKTIENAMGLKLRTHASYETGWVYGTTGNEAITLAMQNPVTAFQIVYGTKPSAFSGSTWQSVTPLFQTKDGKVIINRKITATSETTNLKLFDVNGDANATTLYENGTALSSKYMSINGGGNVSFDDVELAGTLYTATGDDYVGSRLSGYATQTWVSTQIANLVNSAPEALNTLGELATAIQNHEDAYDALLETVGGKLGKTEKAASATVADSVAWSNVTGKPSSYYTLPTRLASNSTSGYGNADEAVEQGWHYMTSTATNRPPFYQVDGMTGYDYRIMTTAYGSTWLQQIATDFRSNDIFTRRCQNGTWQSWTALVKMPPGERIGTDNAIARWDATRNATIQDSKVTIDDNGNLSTTGTINSYTLAAACAKGVTDSTSASALSTGTNLVTERDVYYGLASINGARQTSSVDIYAPTSIGSNGYLLKATGTGAPAWVDPKTVIVGTAEYAEKADKDGLGNYISSTYAKKEYGVYYVEGNTTGTKGTWTGSNSDITAYYDGLTVNYKIGIAGASTTTLNINGLGAKTCYLRGTTKITTHYAVGTMVLLSYNATTDAFYSADYDANSYAYVRQYTTTTNASYPLLLAYETTAPSNYNTKYTRLASNITANPSTGTVTATTFSGDLSGNATTATKLGTSTVGSTTKPIYLSGGTATACSTYAGGTAVTLNGTDKSATTASFYAPTSAGTSGQVLTSNGSGAPTWTNASSLSVGSATSDGNGNNIASTYLPKTTYEYNKEIAFGSTGKLYIGAFPMYDSNITVEISATTSTTYNATLVIATQNINTTGGGSLTATVYGDATNTIAPNIYIGYASGSNQIHVYFSPQAWSKNLIHIQAVALAGAPSNVCTSVDSIPSTANRQPTNALTANFQAKGTYITPTTGSEYYPKYIQTYLQNKTGWYGTQYPIYAWWETGSICKWVVDNYETKVDRAIKDANGNTITSYYQPKLTSGTNIKTINGTSLLGSGDITISGGSGAVTKLFSGSIMLSDIGSYISTSYNTYLITLSSAYYALGDDSGPAFLVVTKSSSNYYCMLGVLMYSDSDIYNIQAYYMPSSGAVGSDVIDVDAAYVSEIYAFA